MRSHLFCYSKDKSGSKRNPIQQCPFCNIYSDKPATGSLHKVRTAAQMLYCMAVYYCKREKGHIPFLK